MVVNAIRRTLAVAALCAGLGAVLALPASAANEVPDVTITDIFTPPYVQP
ncbi:hypothetical protein [Saccharothrix obliqua]|nr:hypothetical protein [Saccharothrix obliqua]MBW4720730.1 hypothetical protein [Saccharothrix obliqua]